MLEFRPSTLKDVNFVRELFKIGVVNGHYKEEILYPNQIEALVQSKYNLADESQPQTLICTLANKPIGFIVITIRIGGIIEFHYLSFDEKYQNMGFGDLTIKYFEDACIKQCKGAPLFMVRCRESSHGMKSLLKKNNYNEKFLNDSNVTLFAKCTDKKFLTDFINTMN
ncbi:MAG: GNAT family N-acetyltransferase [Sulfurimonadaceae bacterium]